MSPRGRAVRVSVPENIERRGRDAAAGVRRVDAALACLLGLIAFLVICGPRILFPANVAWLTESDPATFLFGWRYFRDTPWSWPPGLNPNYGLSISSSIVYSDSVPLLALLMKLARPLIDMEQYAGIWLLTCFMLQGFFGWLLVGLATSDRLFRLAGAAFLLFMPMFLWRLYGHYALCAQWLVLAGLLLAFRRRRPHFAWWAGLLALAALIQAYILVGLLPLFAANLAQHGSGRWRRVVQEAAITTATTVLVMWLAGYFAVQDGVMAGGYGLFHVNLLSAINPMGWSFLLPTLPSGPGDFEGFIYLGAGGLLLGGVAIISICTRPRLLCLAAPYSLVLLALSGLLLYAVTNVVGFGAHRFVLIRLPLKAEMVANVFRASGRLGWPAAYGVVFACMVIIIRRLGQTRANILLAGALALQVADTSIGWRALYAKLNPSAVAGAAEPRSPFWTEAASTYSRVMLVPPGDGMPNWYPAARFASRYGLPTNAVNFGRIDHDKVNAARRQLEGELSTGQYEPGTLYVLNEQAANLSALSHNPEADLLAQIDGLRVLAPGWKRTHDIPAGARELAIEARIPELKACDTLSFAHGASLHRPALIRGWGTPEDIGVWTTASVAELAFRIPPTTSDFIDLVFNVRAYVPHSIPRQRVRLSVDGETVAEWNFITTVPELRYLRLHRPAEASRTLRLRFDLPDAVSPAQLGFSTDWRFIALSLADLKVHTPGQCEELASQIQDGGMQRDGMLPFQN
jgi:hypothetical protein